MKLTHFIVGATFFSSIAFASATSTALNNVSSSGPSITLAAPTLNITNDQHLARLAQQVKNLASEYQKIDELQKTVQQLDGQIQVLQHDLQLLNTQQRSFYQDLNQRISQVQNLSDVNGNTNSVPNALAKKTPSVIKSDKTSFDAATTLLKKKKLNQAKAAFIGYISSYPNGQYLSNAYYWLGDIYYTQNNYKAALIQFNTVVAQFPKSKQYDESELKIAMISAAQGHKEAAAKGFSALIKAAPNSTAAQLASIQLQKLSAS